MGVKTLLASGLLVGGLAIGTLAFTGTDALQSVGEQARALKDKIVNLDTSLTSWKNAFNGLKADASSKVTEANAKLAEKNSLITTLQEKIAELQAGIEEGSSNETELTAEVERLNGELTKANTEVATLLSQVNAVTAEVAGKGTAVETAPVVKLDAIADKAISLAGIVSPSNQAILTKMGILNISKISKEGTGAVAVYADAGFISTSANPAIFSNKDIFSTAVFPDVLGEHFPDAYGKKLKVYTHAGVLMASYDDTNKTWTQN